MIVLDTDVLSLIQRQSQPEYARLQARLHGQSERVYVTIVSFEEQVRGWMSRLARKVDAAAEVNAYAQLAILLKHYCAERVLEYDSRAAQQCEQLRKSRIRIGTMDLRIASIVLANDALLISRNLRDFERVPGLRVEDWTTVS